MGTQREQIKRVVPWLVRWTRRAGTMLGMKPAMASGCRTGPPSYIGWRAGSTTRRHSRLHPPNQGLRNGPLASWLAFHACIVFCIPYCLVGGCGAKKESKSGNVFTVQPARKGLEKTCISYDQITLNSHSPDKTIFPKAR